MMKSLFPLFNFGIIVLLLLSGCESHPGTPSTQSGNTPAQSNLQRAANPNVEKSQIGRLVSGNAAFAFDLYHAISTDERNQVFSPFSLSIGFAMVYAGAQGETLNQMAQVLHYDLPQEQLHPAFNTLDQDLAGRSDQVEGLPEEDRFKLNIANALWGQNDWPFRPEYLDLLATNYGAGLRLVNFERNPGDACNQINDWVAAQTQDKIQKIVSPDVIDSSTKLALTNAIYFKAFWEQSFTASETIEKPFHLLDGSTISVPIMSIGWDGEYQYASGQGWQAVSLPYKGGMNDMVLIIPDAGAFTSIEDGLSAKFYGEILSAMTRQTLQLYMPKFDFEADYQLAKVLREMGMTDAFSGKADFSGIDGSRDLSISAVVHKATITVDEKGTEAAAATVIAMPATVPNGIPLLIDRPFFFFIRDIPTETILFMGRVLNPAQ